MKTKILQLHIDHTKAMLCILGLLMLACMILYAYFMNMSVVNIVERKNAEKEVYAIGSHVSELEEVYFSKISNIDIEFALTKGFVEVDATGFAYRKTVNDEVLSLNKLYNE